MKRYLTQCHLFPQHLNQIPQNVTLLSFKEKKAMNVNVLNFECKIAVHVNPLTCTDSGFLLPFSIKTVKKREPIARRILSQSRKR